MLAGRNINWSIVGSCLVVAAIALWPVQKIWLSVEPDTDKQRIMAGTPADGYEQPIVEAPHNFSGVAFWLSPHESGAADGTTLTLEITDADTGEVVRSDQRNLPDAQKRQPAKVVFLFRPLWNSAEKNLRLTVHTQDTISFAHALPDMAKTYNQPVALQQFRTVPLAQAVWLSLTGRTAEGEDIFHHWQRGRQILDGINPYTCILDRTCHNDKFAIHLPLFYELSAASQRLGLAEFESWIAWWRAVFVACYLVIGGILFGVMWRAGGPALGLFALLFWLGNRWSLYVLRVAHIDFLALLWLVVSVVLWRRLRPGRHKRHIAASFLLGLSLAIKQVAAPLAPVYLIYSWQATAGEPLRRRVAYVAWHLLAIGAVPALSVAPFVWDQPKGVVQGLLFSVVRDSQADFGAPAVDAILRGEGLWVFSLMFILWAIIYIAVWRRPLPLPAAGLAIMTVFLAFNVVVFNQYFAWLMPFILLVLASLPAQEINQRR